MFGRRVITILITILALVVAAFWLAHWSGPTRISLTIPEVVVRDMLAPLQRGITWGYNFLENRWVTVTHYRQLEQENSRLQAEVGELQLANTRLREQQLENIRLRTLLELQQATAGQLQLVTARVIGRNPQSWYHTLIVDRGRKDGLTPGMTVISHQGLVGRIVAASFTTSEVLLILDRQGAVGGIVQESRVPGIVEGVGDGTWLQMIYLPNDAALRPNQVVVTSGLGGLYAKGLRIGYITSIVPELNGLMQKAYMRPFVDFDHLEEVMIIKSSEGD